MRDVKHTRVTTETRPVNTHEHGKVLASELMCYVKSWSNWTVIGQQDTNILDKQTSVLLLTFGCTVTPAFHFVGTGLIPRPL